MTYIMTGRQLNVLVRLLDELQADNGKLSYDSFMELSWLVRELQTGQKGSGECKKKRNNIFRKL